MQSPCVPGSGYHFSLFKEYLLHILSIKQFSVSCISLGVDEGYTYHMAEHFGEFLKALDAGVSSPAGRGRKEEGGPTVWRRNYAVGETIAEDEENKQAFLLITSGWVASGKMLTNGSRIVLDFLLPGDVVGIGATEWAREVITALSPVSTMEVPGAPLETLLKAPQTVSRALIRNVARHNARIAEHMVSIGRRGAVERTAHLLLELACRLEIKPDNGRVRFQCPLTQADLADALGLTAVHVNRVLKELRENGLASFRNGIVEIRDVDRLTELVDFDASYLTLRTVK